MNQTLSSWLTATPTGTLPTPQATHTPVVKIEPATVETVTKFDAKRIDWISVGIDVASISTTVAAAACPETGWACAVGGVTEIVTIAGITYDIGKAQTPSDTVKVGADTFAGLSDYGRAVPVLGVALSLYDMYDQVFNHGFYTEDVSVPAH